MKREKRRFNELLLRYRKYQKKLQRLEVAKRNLRRQGILRKHIERLADSLQSIYASIKLGTAAVTMTGAMIMTAPDVHAQESPTFQTGQINPFGLSDIGNYSTVALVDIDDDGDLDLFAGESEDSQFNFFENTGTTSEPIFVRMDSNSPFGIVPPDTYFEYSLSMQDLDNDGDYDLLIMDYDQNFMYYENDGTATDPVFLAPVSNPFSLSDTGGNLDNAAVFVDLDGDGDYDIMHLGNYSQPFRFYKNEGTKEEPLFSAPVTDSYGLVGADLDAYGANLSFVDVDKDGDFDLVATTIAESDILYYENIGTFDNPDFAEVQENPFRLQTVDGDEMICPVAGDLDGDGDLDLLSGSLDGNFHFFENHFLNFDEAIESPFSLASPVGDVSPVLVDIDADGDLDVFSGGNGSQLQFFENTGSDLAPDFATPVDNLFDIAETTISPKIASFADIDGDGDQDLFLGGLAGTTTVTLLPNEGTATAPSFGAPVTNPFSFENSYEVNRVSFADLDQDNDLDMILGDNTNEEIYYFENTGSAEAAVFEVIDTVAAEVTNPFVAFVDIDKDGDQDVFSGSYDGLLYFIENIGDATAPEFSDQPLVNPFGLTSGGTDAIPAFGDLDGDGDEDLLLGQESGVFTFFEFTGPVFTSDAETSLDENIASATSVEAADGVEDETYEDLELSVFGGEDAASFNFDPATGALSFLTVPDFENPHDADQDNVYEVSIRVYSAEMESANIQDLTITITDETPSVTLTVTADDQSKNEGEENPTFTISYTGFLTGDDESSLDVVPVATTDATTTSEAGTYAITVSGGESEDRYIFDYVNGTLTINEVLSLLDEQYIRVYPNPVVNELAVSDHQVSALAIYDLKGAKVLETIVDGTVDVSGLEKGVYMIQLRDSDNKVVYSDRIIKD